LGHHQDCRTVRG